MVNVPAHHPFCAPSHMVGRALLILRTSPSDSSESSCDELTPSCPRPLNHRGQRILTHVSSLLTDSPLCVRVIRIVMMHAGDRRSPISVSRRGVRGADSQRVSEHVLRVDPWLVLIRSLVLLPFFTYTCVGLCGFCRLLRWRDVVLCWAGLSGQFNCR